MLRKYSRLLLVLFATTFSLSAGAAPGTKKLADVIREVSARQKSVSTLQADFKQEKVMALLANPETSTGSFTYSKPHNVVWNYSSPRPVTMVIADGWMTTYYPDLNKAEKLEVQKYQDRIFRYMAASGAIDELGKYFNFSFVESKKANFYTLELLPKTQALGKRVQRIKIWIDKTSYLTTKFEYVEGDGDLTRYEFSNVRVNGVVPAATFKLNLPAGVRVEQVKLN
jgi:outer membrane lipoprotein carrier protein